MLRRILISCFGMGLMADTAMALSCMRPDLGQAMEEAKASDKYYSIFVGKFSPQYGMWPKQKDRANSRKRSSSLAGIFDGYALSPDPQFDQPMTRVPVEVQVNCAGPWCGQPPSGEVIAFVENLPNGRYQLSIEACPNTFPSEPKSIEKLRTCFDEECKSDQPDWY